MSNYKYSINIKKLPEGYKHTEVGVIPEDWESISIGELEPYVTSGSRGWAKYYSKFGELFIRITNLNRQSIYLNLQDIKLVDLPKGVSEGKRTKLQNGDILISITADIGIIGYINDFIPNPAYINQHISLVRIEVDNADSKYVAYFLASENVQRLFREATDQGAKAGLNLDTIRGLKLAFPKFPEQKAIAQALSDVDALIAALDKLIAKKRHIKTATMQQLLTGKKRLPGFGEGKGYKKTDIGVIPEDWECESLIDKIVITHGFGFQSRYFCSQGLYNLTTPGNFYEEGGFREIGEKQKYYDGPLPDIYVLQSGDLIVAMTEQAEGLLGSVAFIPSSGTYLHNQRIGRIKPISSNIALGFLYYLFNFTKFRLKVKETAAGTKVKHTSPSKLLEIAVPLPPVLEQKAIAQVLSDIDTEITALEKRRTKTQAIKQGMMQELLTGRTRLSFDKA
ncbi:restriction endonuclease subunit S [Laspinema palackyanum]|uniref:restriction endonuclease subunit S n=1 Tax=Laspinema palackyanum TaxID=3231601 RepID=UPI00345D0834|nr:restriction endonuclease subunit S [Laspinema sp. D2c]